MTFSDVFPAWSRILEGYRPLLSIEITKECPLHCPGCYAYEPTHLTGGVELRQLSDFRGPSLVRRVLDLVKQLRPIHLSIVGGEPLVRYRELTELLPQLDALGIEVQLVTSAVRRIPPEWARLACLHLAISIDGLQPEHDRRRFPATYERILEHIAGHLVNIHCTVTRQMLARADAIAQFSRFWSERDEVRRIWFSLYTPQQGDTSQERLRPEDRVRVVEEIGCVRHLFPKVHMPDAVLQGLLSPPQSPEECTFARVTECVSADLQTRVTPCQFGGTPVCAECGCMASAGMSALAAYRLAGLVRVSDIMAASAAFGERRAKMQARSV